MKAVLRGKLIDLSASMKKLVREYISNLIFFLDWRDGSVVKSTECSSESPEFKSQQPHGGSSLSIMKPDAFVWSV